MLNGRFVLHVIEMGTVTGTLMKFGCLMFAFLISLVAINFNYWKRESTMSLVEISQCIKLYIH